MTEKPKYHDKRADMWRKHFEMGEIYEEFLSACDPAHLAKWRNMMASLPALTDGQSQRLRGYHRTLRVLIYNGAWCGDCVRQVPMMMQIADAAGRLENGGPAVSVRIIDRDVSPELQDELRILGALRVPVVVFFSEDFHEVGRFGDRLLTTYRRKAERETGAACDTGLIAPGIEELAAEQNEWVDVVERMLLMLRLAPPLRARYGD